MSHIWTERLYNIIRSQEPADRLYNIARSQEPADRRAVWQQTFLQCHSFAGTARFAAALAAHPIESVS